MTFDPFSTQQSSNWLALSGNGLVDVWTNPFKQLERGAFIAELRLPLPSATVLISHSSHEGIERSFSLFFDPAVGLSLLHRCGAQVARHLLPAPILLQSDTARLTYKFNTKLNTWSLRLEALNTDQRAYSIAGNGCPPFAMRDAEAICKKAITDPSVLWFGFSRRANLPKSAPWIGQRSLVQTNRGPIAAGRLAAGDVVLTKDRGPLPLQNVQHVQLPARGSFAPILLRCPFYDTQSDVLVSADTRVSITGTAVDYLFGLDEVLVSAADVVDGRTAFAEDRRSMVTAIMLDLGCEARITVGSSLTLALGTSIGGAAGTQTPPLTPYETATLLRMMGRIVRKVA
jgi:hypothetical protein